MSHFSIAFRYSPAISTLKRTCTFLYRCEFKYKDLVIIQLERLMAISLERGGVFIFYGSEILSLQQPSKPHGG